MNLPIDSPHVLVVDDEPAIGRLIAEGLAELCNVTVTGSVAEGEAHLMTNDYHVLLCDAVLPGESGVSFLSRIKLQYPHLRRILMSGRVEKDDLVTALNTGGIVSFLDKPFNLSQLKDVVTRAVADSLRSRREAAMDAEWRYTQHHAPPQRLLALLIDLLLSGRFTVMLIVILLLLALVLAGGVFVLFLLYSLKTWLGIDFFEDMHFHDFWRHF
jgi:CheY-like chemotaxis protein